MSRRLALCLGLLLGCGAAPEGPAILVRLAPVPRAAGCLEGDEALSPTALQGLGGTLRLSVVRRDGGSSRFVCDAALRIPTDAPRLDLGDKGARYDVHAEWFDPSGARAAVGVLPDLPAAAQPGEEPRPLMLYRTGEWSCPASRLRAGRAFHTATPLPSGEILLIGGVAALPEEGPAIFQLLGSVEVYDPRTGRFAEVAEETGVVPRTRAFHQAAVLDGGAEGPVRLIVYGGLTAPPRRAALDGAPGGPSQLRFGPIGTTQAAGAELLTYDPAARRLSRRPLPEAELPRVAFAGGAALPGGGLVVAGGATFPAGREVEGQKVQLSPVKALLAALPADGAPRPLRAELADWLIAPSVTPLGAGAALVLGAARTLPEEPAAVRLRALRASGLAGEGPRLDGGAAVSGPATAYHAAVRLADEGGAATILVSGGFVLEPSAPIQARQPPAAAAALRLYRVQAAAVEHVPLAPYGPPNTCGAAQEHYRAAGFEAASATASSRRAVISGGTPTAQLAGCQDCEPGDNGSIKLLCVLRQASLYSQQSGAVTALPPLGLGRMGHAQSPLPDGSLLVTGGLTRPGGDATPATAEAEVLAPRDRGASAEGDVDDPLRPLLQQEGLSRPGAEAVRPCRAL